jgi:D-tyrosyl-tRNA(Tyr) deacylase
MRFVIQRVTHASCTVDGEVTGSIEKGLMVLVGVGKDDNEQTADKMVTKLVNMRIFEDENGKTNLALKDVGGELLMISQFTLYADCKKGNRPSFIRAGASDMASDLYEYILKKCAEAGIKTGRGIFGADMKIELLNDGPFTIILDSAEL